MENDNSDKVIMYCIIILIVIVAVCAIIGISMIDFSGKDKPNLVMSNSNMITKRETNSTPKTNTIINEKDIIENSATEDNILENDKTNTGDVALEISTILENQETTEFRKKVIVSEDRVTVETDEVNTNLYFKFNELNELIGFYIVTKCETIEEARGYITFFQSMGLNSYEIIDNTTVEMKFPLSQEIYEMNKDEIIESLSREYIIEYIN